MKRGDTRGFTIVEMLVVAVLGAVLVAASYEILRTNQRAYTIQSASVRGQQDVRAGMSILQSELREISRTGGDILSMSATNLTVRVMRSFGVVCDTTLAGSPIYVKRVGRWFKDGDSIFVMADNDPDFATDDTTLTAVVTSIDTTSTRCSGNGVDTVQALTAPALTAATAAGDSIRPGAPVRAYSQFQYALTSSGSGGEVWLKRLDIGGTWQAMVGPLKPGGLTLAYYDSLGAVTTDRLLVYQIEITLQAESPVLGEDGLPVTESLTTRVNLRN